MTMENAYKLLHNKFLRVIGTSGVNAEVAAIVLDIRFSGIVSIFEFGFFKKSNSLFLIKKYTFLYKAD